MSDYYYYYWTDTLIEGLVLINVSKADLGTIKISFSIRLLKMKFQEDLRNWVETLKSFLSSIPSSTWSLDLVCHFLFSNQTWYETQVFHCWSMRCSTKRRRHQWTLPRLFHFWKFLLFASEADFRKRYFKQSLNDLNRLNQPIV